MIFDNIIEQASNQQDRYIWHRCNKFYIDMFSVI